jgi:hypothetical protein
VIEEAITHDPRARATVGPDGPARMDEWHGDRRSAGQRAGRGADHRELGSDPVYDIAWIVFTLSATGLTMAYTFFVAGPDRWESALDGAVDVGR